MSDFEKCAGGVWVFAETGADGKLRPVVPELLGRARALADALGTRLTAVLIGREELCRELIAFGADIVLLCGAQPPDEETYTDIIAALARERGPEILLLGATAFGRSLAPRIAARLETGLTADCTELSADPETRLLRQTRPAFGGNLMATIVCERRRPQMATARPRVFPRPEPDWNRKGSVERLSVTPGEPRTVYLAGGSDLPEAVNIAEYDILVGAGRGAVSPKALALVKTLAEKLGGQWSASRALVDAGKAEYARQVGQTGRTVSPKLYIAVGISGAVQHLAGLANIGTLVAINSDPDAPIFEAADFGIVGDALDVLPELIARL